MNRTLRIGTADVAFGRIARLRRPPREGPKCAPKLPFHCDETASNSARRLFPPAGVKDFDFHLDWTAPDAGSLQFAPDVSPDSTSNFRFEREVFQSNIAATRVDRLEVGVK